MFKVISVLVYTKINKNNDKFLQRHNGFFTMTLVHQHAMTSNNKYNNRHNRRRQIVYTEKTCKNNYKNKNKHYFTFTLNKAPKNLQIR